MVLGRRADVITDTACRLAPSKISNIQHILTGLSPPEDNTNHALGFSNSGLKNNLHLSSSLQDLSSYRCLDLEGGDVGLELDRNSHTLQRENAGSSFSKEKALQGRTPFLRGKCVRLVMIILCLVLLIFLAYLSTIYIYSHWSQEASKYYVVLDCGSTGTRVYVYQASIDHKEINSLPFLLKSVTDGHSRKSKGRAYDRMETEPGFHTLVHKTSGLKAAINPLLKWAEKQIPVHAHKSTSLFLCATAGVRRLPSAHSKWLLDKAYSILKHSPFLCRKEWVKIISGTEEAYYGWIALNYGTGTLGASPRQATYGALDMGGSSLQVTFESEKNGNDDVNLNLRIGSVYHHLNAYSLAGYGLNDAFDKSVLHILRRTPNANLVSENVEIKHPCLQSGYKDQYICSRCAAIQQDGMNPAVGARNSGKGAKAGVPVQVVGSPNWEECSALARITVNLSEWSNQSLGIDCDLRPCALPENLPRPYGQFYGMSGFFVVYQFFNLTPESALDDVLERGREFCEKTWEVAKVSVPPQPYIEQYCFRAPYIVSLLREGLHITDKQIIIGSGSITWTFGVALLEAGKSFSTSLRVPSYEIFQVKIHPLVLIAILFSSLVLLVCALLCVGNCIPRFFRRSYMPVLRHSSASTSSVLNIPSPFRFQRWSPISSGDGRMKMPLSPIASSQQGPFGFGQGLGGSSIQQVESSLYPSASSMSHSYSSSDLGQMIESNMSAFRTPHRSQMRLQSRRSQSREDLNSSLADAHMVKV